jgi:MFS family permease
VLRVLRHRDFGLLWLGQAVSLIGDGVYLVAIAWLVLDISNEPTALGLVGLAWMLPLVVSLRISGVLSDRFERRRLMIAADLLRCGAIGAIAALAVAETAELWQVIALVVVYGIGQALFQPTFSAIVPDIVPREQLLQANAVRELMEPLGMRFAGPALGGLLIAVFGVGEALVIDAATFAISAIAVSFMASQPPPREEPGPGPSGSRWTSAWRSPRRLGRCACLPSSPSGCRPPAC